MEMGSAWWWWTDPWPMSELHASPEEFERPLSCVSQSSELDTTGIKTLNAIQSISHHRSDTVLQAQKGTSAPRLAACGRWPGTTGASRLMGSMAQGDK